MGIVVIMYYKLNYALHKSYHIVSFLAYID